MTVTTKQSDQLLPFLSCPIPITQYPKVMLAHGSGGKLMHQLVEQMFRKTFAGHAAGQGHDAFVFKTAKGRMAFTTDTYVVNPVFFPGGDIGTLAVNGTVNDLAMSGAKPLYLSLGLTLEEGLSMDELWRVTQSINGAAQKAGVTIVTGDTKVVDKGKGDKIFINTSGIGVVEHKSEISPCRIKPGDTIILNGDIARHGMAIMATREGLAFESQIESDTASLSPLVQKLLQSNIRVHCMRDLTRGGLSSALNELSIDRNLSIEIDERSVPVREDVASACELLGLDPFFVANEGRFIAFIDPKDEKKALDIFRSDDLGKGASVIGRVLNEEKPLVKLRGKIGALRILEMPPGEQLPRIC